MSLSRPDQEDKEFFAEVVPGDPRILIRPMFGSLAGFINGNMFTGLYGRQIFVRLPEADRARLLAEEGATEFSPMPGRPMKEYVALPDKWRQEPEKISGWMEQSLAWVQAMPEKVPAKKKTTKKEK